MVQVIDSTLYTSMVVLTWILRSGRWISVHICCKIFLRLTKQLLAYNVIVQNGHIKRCTDEDIQSSVLEIMGCNVSTNYITCPTNPKEGLAIKLPFLVMIIKNMKRFFSFEVQVLDDKNMKRRFRASNYQVAHYST